MYPKRKILEATEFSAYRDILGALLESGRLYSLEEVRAILDAFLTKEVR